MTVKMLINELLDKPMDAEVQLAYVQENYDYDYQPIFSAVLYDEENEVGLLGIR